MSQFGYQQTSIPQDRKSMIGGKNNAGCQPVTHSCSTYLVTFHFLEYDKPGCC